MNEYILLFLGFILIRDYIQWRRDLERQEKLVEKMTALFGGGVAVSATPAAPAARGVSRPMGVEVPNEIAKEDENEIDLQDLNAFDLPEDYNIEVEENPPEAGMVRGEK